MGIFREDSGGSLHELGPIYREAAGGTLHEIGVIYREESDGTLTKVYVLGDPEDLFPDSDISSSGFTDNVVGDGDGALWDEIDEDPADDDTTAIDGTVRTLGGSGTDTFRVGLEPAAETHSQFQTYTIWVRLKRLEGNTDDGIVEIRGLRLYQGGTLIDEHTSALTAMGETYEYRSHAMVVDGTGAGGAGAEITDWSDLRIEVDVYTESVEYPGPDFSATKSRVTQAYLEITA